jgi:transcription elongation factor Elf1
MYRITKEDLYDKREMKTRRKIYSTFTCPTCKEIVSIKTHTYFYLISEHLTGPLDCSGRFCSTDCLFRHLDSFNIDIDKIIEEHNTMMDKLDELDKEK